MNTGTFKLKKIIHVLPGLDFNSGDKDINDYFHSKIYEDVENGNTMAYFLFHNDYFIGFFTLSNSKIYIEIDNRKQSWPATLLGWLGVQYGLQKKGYGSLMVSMAKKLSFDSRLVSGCRVLILKTYKKELVNSFFKKQHFLIVEEKREYVSLYYDLNDWPDEEPNIKKKWSLET